MARKAAPKTHQFPASLSQKQVNAILALAQGKTFTEVAKLVSIDRSTLYGWRQDEVFAGTLRSLQTDVLSGAIGILKSRAQGAAKTICDCAEFGDDPEAPRVPAARANLDYAFKGVEFEDLVKRIEELERGEKPAPT